MWHRGGAEYVTVPCAPQNVAVAMPCARMYGTVVAESDCCSDKVALKCLSQPRPVLVHSCRVRALLMTGCQLTSCPVMKYVVQLERMTCVLPSAF